MTSHRHNILQIHSHKLTNISKLVFALILACFVSCSHSSTLPIVIECGVELFDQQIMFGDTITFQLGHLIPNQEYEVRVSSPGTFAAEFSVDLICDLYNYVPNQVKNRNILNVEKTMFKTDASGHITQCAHIPALSAPVFGVSVHARQEGYTNDPSLLSKPVAFNIALDQCVFGIPARSIGVIIFIVFAVCFLIVFICACPMMWTPLTNFAPTASKIQENMKKRD